MKTQTTALHQLANMTPPVWQKDAITGFGDKLADSLTLIASPTWQAFAQHQVPEWEAEHITRIKQCAATTTDFAKNLVDYAEKSADYFHNYSCTTHLYALKAYGDLHTEQRKFSMRGIWSVF